MAENVKITSDDIKKACDVVNKSPDVVRTPLLQHVQPMFPALDQSVDLYMKLESMQTTGLCNMYVLLPM